jgi:phosphate transport system permease protein
VTTTAVAPPRPSAAAVSVSRSISAKGRDVKGMVFQGALLFTLLATLGILVVLVIYVVDGAWPIITDRPVDFVTHGLSRDTAAAGVWDGIRGSLTIAAIVVLVAFPIGIATAVYLEEYATDGPVVRFITLNVRNLAGVPSVVYGILGLTLFVKLLGDDLSDGGGLTGGRSVIAAGLTLAALVLPIVIITSMEALRAVPRAIREAGYGVGASRWEVTKSLVLPSAAPGILTGSVLSLSRAIGEAAPILLIGASYTYFSYGDQSVWEQMRGSFTALPAIIFGWARDPDPGYKPLASAAIVVILLLTLLVNAVAIALRNRYERNW